MLQILLLAAITLPPADVSAFAARVAQAAGAANAGSRVLLRVDDPGGTGAAEQLRQALRDSLREQKLDTMTEGEAPLQILSYLGMRRDRPLAIARIVQDGRELQVLFAEFTNEPAAAVAPPAGPAVAIRTRSLFSPEFTVLDLEADTAGNLFLAHPDRIRVFDLNASGLPLKAEVGLETGAEHLRDPLVRMQLRDTPHQLELYSAAPMITNPPPVPLEGYALKAFPAAVKMRVTHPWRAVSATLQLANGRNYFRSATVPELWGLAPVLSPLRAHWIVLDTGGHLQLADADLRLMGAPYAGTFGGDVASASLPCAGTVVLAASSDAAPARDRITVLRVENDQILPYTTIEIEGAVRRLKALPAAGDQRRILAVSEVNGTTRIEEIELRCSP